MKESLVSLFNMFETVDNQGWCDIGYESCQQISSTYDLYDWKAFITSIGELKEDVLLGVIEILPLIPEELHPDTLKMLLLHGRKEAWIETFSIVSSLFFENSKSIINVIDISYAKLRFETEFIAWVNFPYNSDNGFNDYYVKYKHLIDDRSRKFYESIATIT